MQSLLQKVEEIDTLIRKMSKIKALMDSGMFIEGWRQLQQIIAFLDDHKKKIIAASEKETVGEAGSKCAGDEDDQ